MNVIKGIYASILEKNGLYILYSLYGYIYIMLIIPSKIYAGLTLSDTSWGTSSRKVIFDKINYGNIFMLIWIFGLISIILYDLTVAVKTTNNMILLGLISSFIFLSFSCIKVYINLKTNKN